jgi:hypothetical protein
LGEHGSRHHPCSHGEQERRRRSPQRCARKRWALCGWRPGRRRRCSCQQKARGEWGGRRAGARVRRILLGAAEEEPSA